MSPRRAKYISAGDIILLIVCVICYFALLAIAGGWGVFDAIYNLK